MSNYSIALFLHIVGALGFFAVLGVEWIGLSRIRKASTPVEAGAVLGMIAGSTRFGMISMITTVVTGVYMALTVWGWVAWILNVLGALVLEILVFARLTAPRLKAVGRALSASNGQLSPAFHKLLSDPVLWGATRIRVAVGLSIILLKFTKPDLIGSLLTVGVAIVLAIASALPMLRRVQVQEGSAG